MVVRVFSGKRPSFGKRVFVDETAVVIGDVRLADDSSVWPGAILRADDDFVDIGPGTAMLDMSFAEAPKGKPVQVGKNCLVSHGAKLHGCRLEDSVLVGIGAIVLDGASIGEGSVVASGSLVSPGTAFPARSFIVGTPGKVTRQTTDEELSWTRNECDLLKAKAAKYESQRQSQAI